MALSPRLEIRQGQALVMTPQLQQAIKLLQFNNIELAAYVEQEVEQNPLLEHADPEVPERGDREGMDTERVSVSPEKNNESYDELESSEPDAAQLSASDTMLESSDAPLDINYNEVLEADPEPAPMGPSVELSNSQGRSDEDTKEIAKSVMPSVEKILSFEATVQKSPSSVFTYAMNL